MGKNIRKKEKKSVFWIVFWIVCSIAAIAIAVTLIVLNNFLEAYENSQPKYCMDEIMEHLKSADVEYLYNYFPKEVTDTIDKTQMKKLIESKLKDGDLTYTKLGNDESKDTVKYIVKLNGTKLTQINLKSSDIKGDFDTNIWEMSEIEGFFSYIAPIKIVVPVSFKVTLNDVDIEEIYEGTEEENKIGVINSYCEIPNTVTYLLDKLYEEPDIKVYGNITGTEIQAEETSLKDGTRQYKYDWECNDSLLDSLKDIINQTTNNYILYITGDKAFSTFSNMIDPNTKIYSVLKGMLQDIKWYAAHSSVDITELQYSDMKQYTKDAFTVKVSFTYTVVTSGENHVFPSEIEYSYVKQGNNWIIVDMDIS